MFCIVRTKNSKTALGWLVILSLLSFFIASYAAHLHGVYFTSLLDPIDLYFRIFDRSYLGWLAVTLPIVVVLLTAERRLPWLTFALHRIPLVLAIGASFYWGREAILPIPPRTPFRARIDVGRISSPWSDDISPLPHEIFQGPISIEEGVISINGHILCKLDHCTTEFREKFEEYKERYEAVGGFQRDPGPDFVVFASAATPVPALARVIREARALGLRIDVGVVRAHEQQRPVFGTMEYVEAGIVPGAADFIANRSEEVSWGEWLSMH